MKLTERRFLTSAVTSTDLIHVVVTGDTFDSPQGSSFQVDLGKVINDLVPKDVTYTNPSGSTITVGGIPSGTTFNNRTMSEMWTDLLYPFQPPSFNLFSRTGILTEYELGRPVSATTETFTWGTSFPSNVSANTITIQQITPSSVTLISGLLNNGSESINLSSQQTISASTPQTLELYKITGTNTKGTPFTSSISRTWKPRWYYGKYIGGTITDNQITGLTGTNLITSIVNTTVSIGSSPTSEFLYFAIPSSIIPQPTVFTVVGFSVPMIPTETRSIVNSYGVSVNYLLYRTLNPVQDSVIVSLTKP